MRLQPLRFGPERWRISPSGGAAVYRCDSSAKKSIGFSRRGVPPPDFEPRKIFQTSLRKILNTGELLVLVCWRGSQSILKSGVTGKVFWNKDLPSFLAQTVYLLFAQAIAKNGLSRSQAFTLLAKYCQRRSYTQSIPE
jgi:hypothetical protein